MLVEVVDGVVVVELVGFTVVVVVVDVAGGVVVITLGDFVVGG